MLRRFYKSGLKSRCPLLVDTSFESLGATLTNVVLYKARRAAAMITRYASFALTTCRLWAGKILNAAGVPGVVQPGTYEAGIGQATVRITLGPLFTVVTVNGVDVYLDRFTGAVDGVGFNLASGCMADDTARAAHAGLRA